MRLNKKLFCSLVGCILLIANAHAIDFSLDSLPDISDIPTSIDFDDIGEIGDVSTVFDDYSADDSFNGVGEVESLSGFTQATPWSDIDDLAFAETNLTNDLSCIEYSVTGMCFSYRISWTGIHFYSYIQVEHYSRDTHVETTGRLPEFSDEIMPTDELVGNTMSSLTTEIGQMFDPTLQMSDMMPFRLSDSGKYIYKDAFVMGNPELVLFDNTVGLLFDSIGWCNSQNIEYGYYFSSAIDQWSWRMLATTEFFLTGAYAVSAGGWNPLGTSYGSTFPRMGLIEGSDEHKASVVAALRAVSIAAENRELYDGLLGAHVYNPMNEFASNTWTSSTYTTPHRAEKFKMSMIYPYEGEACTRYTGMSMDDDTELSKNFAEDNNFKSAAFKVYRPFRCCQKRGTHLLTVHVGSNIGYK